MTKPSLATIGALIMSAGALVDCLSRDWRSPNYFAMSLMLVGLVVMFIGIRKARSAPKQSPKPIKMRVFVLGILVAVVTMPILDYYRGGIPLRTTIPATLLTVVIVFFCGVWLRRQGRLR